MSTFTVLILGWHMSEWDEDRFCGYLGHGLQRLLKINKCKLDKDSISVGR